MHLHSRRSFGENAEPAKRKGRAKMSTTKLDPNELVAGMEATGVYVNNVTVQIDQGGGVKVLFGEHIIDGMTLPRVKVVMTTGTAKGLLDLLAHLLSPAAVMESGARPEGATMQ